MEKSVELENKLNQIIQQISRHEISPEFIELSGLFKEHSRLKKRINKDRWEKLTLSEKIQKRRDDLLATEKLYEKFTDEITCVYLFKKLYNELVESILIIETKLPTLAI